jgi:hypothetical protein
MIICPVCSDAVDVSTKLYRRMRIEGEGILCPHCNELSNMGWELVEGSTLARKLKAEIEAEMKAEEKENPVLSWGALLKHLQTMSESELKHTVCITDGGDTFGQEIKTDRQGHMYIKGF